MQIMPGGRGYALEGLVNDDSGSELLVALPRSLALRASVDYGF